MEKIYEGTISCKAILEARKRKCSCLYIDKKKRNKEFRYIISLAKSQNCKVEFMERSQMEKLTSNKRFGGILLKAECAKKEELKDVKGSLFYIDGVEDPYNLGSVCRTLYASGCDGLILPNRDWSDAEVTILKASAGAFEKLPIYWIEKEEDLISYLDQHQIPLYCAYRANATNLFEIKFPKDVCIAIGGALRGLSATIINHSSKNIVIPYGREFRNALDTPSATAILSYELFRQKSE